MGLMERLLADMRAQEPTHIACTGDLINIGLHGEFKVARSFMELLGPPARVSFVPGNHDAYHKTTFNDIERFLGPWMTSDTGRFEGFPYVRLVGPIAIVGLSSAVVTGPFVASGTLGPEQRTKLANVLAFLGQQPLCRVILIHHPPHKNSSHAGRGLTDGAAFQDILEKAGAELILHGHNHVTSVNRIAGPKGSIPSSACPPALPSAAPLPTAPATTSSTSTSRPKG